MILTTGQKYDPCALRFAGWSNPHGNILTGYSALDFLDEDGVYLGPDEYGIEPVFQPVLEYRADICGPRLVDPGGGVWWPTDDTREIIEASDDPEAEARRQERDGGGRWVEEP